MLLTAVVLLTGRISLCAQGPDVLRWDMLLDRYERISNMCLELKGDAARDVPAGKMEHLLDELSGLKAELSESGSRMPAAARQRYETIRSAYAAGVKAGTRKFRLPVNMPALAAEPPAKAPVTSVVGSCERRKAVGVDYKWNVCASAVVLPEFSAGLMAAYVPGAVGAYAAFRSNYSFHSVSYSALSDGTSDGMPVWTSGRTAVDRLFVTAGPVLRLPGKFSAFVGLGYGMRRLCWEDSEGAWMDVSDVSRRGLCAELGVSYRIGRVTFAAGWLSLPLSYNGLTLSAGWSFGPYPI